MTSPCCSKTTFGLVGCGRVAAQHMRAVADQRQRARWMAVCDPRADRLAEARAATGAPGYASLKELLADHRPDVIVLASPSGLHPSQAKMAAAAGCHVLSEKPIATRWKDGVDMVTACEQAGVKLFVVKQLRYNPSLQTLRRALDDGRFGKVSMVDVDVFWTRPQSYYDRDDWRGTRALDGGAFLNQTSHYVDLLTWLFGPVDSVHGFMATLGRDIEVEDSGTLTLRWRTGALGSMSVTMLTHPHNLRASITVAGSHGTAVLGGAACDTIEAWRVDDDIGDDIDDINQRTAQFYGDGHLLYYANVLDVLDGRARADTDGREGLKSLEVICAAYRANRQGRRVDLPLDRGTT